MLAVVGWSILNKGEESRREWGSKLNDNEKKWLMLHSVSRTILRTEQGRGLAGENLQVILWLPICFMRQTRAGAKWAQHSFCVAVSKVLCAQCHSSLSAEGIFFQFGTNPVMDHWDLAPLDSQHNVSLCVSWRARSSGGVLSSGTRHCWGTLFDHLPCQ